VERGSIFMVGPGRQLTLQRHCSRACSRIFLAGSMCKPNLSQKCLLL